MTSSFEKKKKKKNGSISKNRLLVCALAFLAVSSSFNKKCRHVSKIFLGIKSAGTEDGRDEKRNGGEDSEGGSARSPRADGTSRRNDDGHAGHAGANLISRLIATTFVIFNTNLDHWLENSRERITLPGDHTRMTRKSRVPRGSSRRMIEGGPREGKRAIGTVGEWEGRRRQRGRRRRRRRGEHGGSGKAKPCRARPRSRGCAATPAAAVVVVVDGNGQRRRRRPRDRRARSILARAARRDERRDAVRRAPRTAPGTKDVEFEKCYSARLSLNDMEGNASPTWVPRVRFRSPRARILRAHITEWRYPVATITAKILRVIILSGPA
ncbi:hypothetical protein PUN28_006395 [Cardiocondyla obscurior]|uniref:Uncharacterized protein n=1 Tax=Cardiocondyla obscurior TaxID=286306 RepID=A0AAW2GDQ9_9HYME